MAKRARRKIDAALKAKIALEALREQASLNELAQRYQVERSLSVISTSGAKPCFLMSLRIRFTAVSRSRTSPSSSMARQSQNCRPAIATAISSRCQPDVGRGCRRRSSRANKGPNFRTQRRANEIVMRNLTWRAETRYRSRDNATCLAVPLFVQSQRLLCAKAAANLGAGHSDPRQSLRLVHIHPDMAAAWWLPSLRETAIEP